MNRVCGLLSSLAIACSPSAVAGDSELGRFFDTATTIQASFQQEIYSADGELVEESAGVLSISRPGRFRWEYDEPEQLIIADGDKLWLYDIELDQVTVSDQAENVSGSPAALLGGDDDALEGFTVLKEYAAEGTHWTRLEPREPDSDFRTVSIGFRDGVIAAMELTDALGQLTRIRFSDVVVNPLLGEDLFAIEIPDGVDIIDRTNPQPKPSATERSDG